MLRHNVSSNRRPQSRIPNKENEKITLALWQIVRGSHGFNKTTSDNNFNTVSLPPRLKLANNSISNLHRTHLSSHSLNATPTTSSRQVPHVAATKELDIPADCISLESGFCEGLETDASQVFSQGKTRLPVKATSSQPPLLFMKGTLHKDHSFGELSKSVARENVVPRSQVSHTKVGQNSNEAISWRPSQNYISEAECESTPDVYSKVDYNLSLSSDSEFESNTSTCSERHSTLPLSVSAGAHLRRPDIQEQEASGEDTHDEGKSNCTFDLNGDTSVITYGSPVQVSKTSTKHSNIQRDDKSEGNKESCIKNFHRTKVKAPLHKDAVSEKRSDTHEIEITCLNDEQVPGGQHDVADMQPRSAVHADRLRKNSRVSRTKLHHETSSSTDKSQVPANHRAVPRKHEKCGSVFNKENKMYCSGAQPSTENNEANSDFEIDSDDCKTPLQKQPMNSDKVSKTRCRVSKQVSKACDVWPSIPTHSQTGKGATRRKSPRLVLKRLCPTDTSNLNSTSYLNKNNIKEVENQFNAIEVDQCSSSQDNAKRKVVHGDESCYAHQTTAKIRALKDLQPVNSTHTKRNEACNQKPTQTSTEIALDSWVVKLKQNSVVVEGNRVDDDLGPWKSSTIVQRISRTRVKTQSGSLYKLQGPMCSSLAEVNGLPKALINAFMSGFPPAWKRLVDEALKTPSRHTRSTSSKVKLNKATRSTSANEKSKLQGCSRSTDKHTKPLHTSKAKAPKRFVGCYGLYPCNDKQCKVCTPIPFTEKFSPDALPRTRSGRIVFPPLEYWHNQYRSHRDGKAILVSGCPGNRTEIPLPDIVTSCKPPETTLARKKYKSSAKKAEAGDPKKISKLETKQLKTNEAAQEPKSSCEESSFQSDREKRKRGRPRRHATAIELKEGVRSPVNKGTAEVESNKEVSERSNGDSVPQQTSSETEINKEVSEHSNGDSVPQQQTSSETEINKEVSEHSDGDSAPQQQALSETERNNEVSEHSDGVSEPQQGTSSETETYKIVCEHKDSNSERHGRTSSETEDACRLIYSGVHHARNNGKNTSSSSKSGSGQHFKLPQPYLGAEKLVQFPSTTPTLKHRLRSCKAAKPNHLKCTIAADQKLPPSKTKVPMTAVAENTNTRARLVKTSDTQDNRYSLRSRGAKSKNSMKSIPHVDPVPDSEEVFITVEADLDSARMEGCSPTKTTHIPQEHCRKRHPASNHSEDSELASMDSEIRKAEVLRKKLFSTVDIGPGIKSNPRRKRKAVMYIESSDSSSDDGSESYASVLKRRTNISRSRKSTRIKGTAENKLKKQSEQTSKKKTEKSTLKITKKTEMIPEKKAARKPPEVTAGKGTLARRLQIRDYLTHASEGYEADVLEGNLPVIPQLVGEDESSSDEDLNRDASKTPPNWLHLSIPRSARQTPVLPEYINPRVLDTADRKAVDKYIHNRRKKGQESPLTKRPRSAKLHKSKGQEMRDIPDDIFQTHTSSDDDEEEKDVYFSDEF